MIDKTAFQWGLEPLRKYARFSGRARRAEYWWFYLLSLFVSGFGTTIDRLSNSPYAGNGIALALALPTIAVTVRRFHDGGRSGWWLWLFLLGAVALGLGLGVSEGRGMGLTGLPLMLAWFGGLVIVGSVIVFLIWVCTRGTDGENRYGPDPLDEGDGIAEVFA